VECALKACIAKLTRRYDFPEMSRAEVYTHDLTLLVKLARLDEERKAKSERSHEFSLNWDVVKEWEERSRYELPSAKQAEDMFSAVSGRKHRVLRWIKQHW
jgi:hypothetical protein